MTDAAPQVDIIVEQLRRQVPGGIGTYCKGLLLGLSSLVDEARPSVSLRASRPPAGGADPLARLGFDLETSSLPGQALTRLWDLGLPVGWLADRRRNAVVHATSFAFPPVSRQPLVMMVHDLAWRRFPEAYPPRGRAWHERALHRASKAATAFVVPSEHTAEDLLAAGLGLSASQVRVAEEGVDHLAPPDHRGAAHLLERAGLHPGDGYLLTVGTLEPRKNLPALLDAYSEARPHLQSEWPLLVVGPSGWGDSALVARGGGPGVIPVGQVEDGVLSALYAGARCTAYVPMVEGFGLPAAEAMAAGSPVVASLGLPSTKGAALEVEPSDVDALAEALVLASSEGPERDGLVASGRKRAVALTWSSCAAVHVELWRELTA